MSDISIGTKSEAIRIYDRIAPRDCAGLTVNDASAYGGWCRSTTYVLLAEGRIKSVLVRGRRIVLRQSVDDYLNSLVKEGD